VSDSPPDTASPEAGLDSERARRLEGLYQRLTALNWRSRALRLSRCTKSGAFDMARLTRRRPELLDQLHARLGFEDGDVIPLALIKSVDADEKAIAKELQTLEGAARSDWLQTGVSSLQLGWPFLRGTAPDGAWLRAPVLLYPAKLEVSTRGPLRWLLEITGLPVFNPSLAHSLKLLTPAAPTLEDLLEGDDDGLLRLDEETFLAIVDTLSGLGLQMSRKAAHWPQPDAIEDASQLELGPPGEWCVEHQLVLGRFPPSGSTLVGDYEALLQSEDGLGDERLGLSVHLLGADETEAAPAPPARALEDEGEGESHEALSWLTLASDASQDKVLAWLDSDDHRRGLVVQGPPGTGKSQLIANVLTLALARGLRVLVCCEKRAALDVVYERLSSVGLGEPLALVHDVAGDRNVVCRELAQSIDRSLQHEELAVAEEVGEPPDLVRMRARLELGQGAWKTLGAPVKTSQGERPGLAELFERALEDDGRPLPKLTRVAADVGEQELHAWLPQIQAQSTATKTIAKPHPLADRGDWAEVNDAGLNALRGWVEAARDACLRDWPTVALDTPSMTPAECLQHQEALERSGHVMALFEDPTMVEELNRFLLFWTWTDGRAATGEWQQVMTQLQDAKVSLKAIPETLVDTSDDQLEVWEAELKAFDELQRRWWRVLSPAWWRARKVPAAIDGFYAPGATTDERALVPVDMTALVPLERGNKARERLAQIRQWQDLNAAMPDDNPFLRFGFQGDPQEVQVAIDEMANLHGRVRAVHDLHQALAGACEAYAELPALGAADDPTQLPFVRAALDDRKRLRKLAALDEVLATAPQGDFEQRRKTARQRVLKGDYAGAAQVFQEILDVWEATAVLARDVDAAMASWPRWARRFLRQWGSKDRHLDPVADARTAMERAWRGLALRGTTRQAVEAPLVDAGTLAAMGDDLQACRTAAASAVAARWQRRLDAFSLGPTHGKQARQLAAQARKQRYRMTLRQMVAQFWDKGMAVARPVWLCSPDSAAALFPLQRDIFDLVIFDEASQLPVESALTILLRAKRALVAGDDQQMPPTAFFQSSHGVERDLEDSMVMGSQSLLELARVAFPSIMLRYHYRSRHESLIAFSNEAFYGGALVTAPRSERISPAPELEGLHWHRVEGLWQDQRNLAEADAAVELVARLVAMQTPSGGLPTVGVVTFNLTQAEIIAERLAARRFDDPAFARFWSADTARPASEQLFVRNLENVQGDERDVIIMSVGYGPTEAGGRVAARFGPLGLAGGEKRLNVAATRAKLGVHVIASFEPGSLEVKRTRRDGPRLFAAYLTYVQAMAKGDVDVARAALNRAGELGVVPPVDARAKDVLAGARTGKRVAGELAMALREAGMEVHLEVGAAHQRLDLGIVGPDGDYVLGVDCGAYLGHPEPLTRDIYRPAYWGLNGWRVLRVSPGQWLEEPDKVIARINRLALGPGGPRQEKA